MMTTLSPLNVYDFAENTLEQFVKQQVPSMNLKVFYCKEERVKGASRNVMAPWTITVGI